MRASAVPTICTKFSTRPPHSQSRLFGPNLSPDQVGTALVGAAAPKAPRKKLAHRQDAFAAPFCLQIADSRFQQVVQRDHPHQLARTVTLDDHTQWLVRISRSRSGPHKFANAAPIILGPMFLREPV